MPDTALPASGPVLSTPAPSFLRRHRGLLAGVLATAVAAAAVGGYAWWSSQPRAAKVVEYAMPVATDIPTAIAIGPDGSAWVSLDFADAIVVVRDGKLQRIPKGSRSTEPIGITVDPSGTAWVTDAASIAIVSVTPDGKIGSTPLGTPIARLGRMATAPDGGIWFAESTAYSITRLKDGQLKRHEIVSSRGGPYGVAAAADGTVWATLQSANSLLRIATDGRISEHEIPSQGTSPTDVTVDGAGAVWFLQFRTERIGRYAGGRFDEFPLPETKVGLSGLAAAPDGAVWFGLLKRGSLGRLRDGKFVEYKLPGERARPYSVAVDPKGNVWYADISGTVGMLPAAEASR